MGSTNAAQDEGKEIRSPELSRAKSEFGATDVSNEPRSLQSWEPPVDHHPKISELAEMPNQVSELRGDQHSRHPKPLR